MEGTKMLRWGKVIFAVLFLALLPLAAYADKVEILDGDFAFLHAPVNPADPDGVCMWPPGLLFNVISDSFFGALVTEESITEFEGIGEASGCAFLEPVFGVAAVFTGSFTWQTADGELRGNFALLDFPTEYEGVFAAIIFVTFDGGTGRFEEAKGGAIAEGLDFPFGGVFGDPYTAGVVAETIAGELKLED